MIIKFEGNVLLIIRTNDCDKCKYSILYNGKKKLEVFIVLHDLNLKVTLNKMKIGWNVGFSQK